MMIRSFQVKFYLFEFGDVSIYSIEKPFIGNFKNLFDDLLMIF